jgi:hypothetical protein
VQNQGCIYKKKSGGCSCVSEEAVWQVRTTFNQSPRKSVCKESHELQTSKTSVWQVLCRQSHETLQI